MPQKYHKATYTYQTIVDGEPTEVTRELILGFNNQTYERLFDDLGFDAKRHDQARKRLALLNAKAQAQTATDDELLQLANFDLVDLFDSEAGDITVATKLFFAGCLEQQPDLSYDEIAQSLDAATTRRLVREAVLPALFAYYGVDFGQLIHEAEAQIEAATREAAEGKAKGRSTKKAAARKSA